MLSCRLALIVVLVGPASKRLECAVKEKGVGSWMVRWDWLVVMAARWPVYFVVGAIF